MAAAAWDIITVAQAKDYLNIGVAAADTNQDTWLQEKISDISGEIENYCRRKFAVQSISNEIYDGNSWRVTSDRMRIMPVYCPVTQISTATSPQSADILAAVQYRDDPDSSWTDIEDTAGHIYIDNANGYIGLFDTAFPYGVQNIRLNYKAGYSTIPQGVKNVCLEMMAMMWKESNRSALSQLGRSSKSSSGFTEAFLDMDSRWKKVLDRYRIMTT